MHLPYCFVVSATYKSKVQLPWIVPEISAIFDGYQSDDWDYTRQKLIGMVFAQFFPSLLGVVTYALPGVALCLCPPRAIALKRRFDETGSGMEEGWGWHYMHFWSKLEYAHCNFMRILVM